MGKFSKFLKDTGMGFHDLVNSGVDYIGGLLNRFNEPQRNAALEDSTTLMNTQAQLNKEQAEHGMGLQKDMANYTTELTSPKMQMERYKEAGLNPALMYGMGGGGGTTTSTGSQTVSGVSPSNTDYAQRVMAKTQQMGMALQLSKLKSEIDVNKSVAEVNKATATKQTAEAQTTESTRDILVQKLKEEGIAQVLENSIKSWQMGNKRTDFADVLGGAKDAMMKDDSLMAKQIAGTVLKTFAEKDNIAAQEALSNEKAKIIWEELYVAQQNANSKEVEAKAKELATMWTTGEMTNWKTWAELGAQAVELTTDAIGTLYSPVKTIKTLK